MAQEDAPTPGIGSPQVAADEAVGAEDTFPHGHAARPGPHVRHSYILILSYSNIPHLDLGYAPYVLYRGKYIDPVSLNARTPFLYSHVPMFSDSNIAHLDLLLLWR